MPRKVEMCLFSKWGNEVLASQIAEYFGAVSLKWDKVFKSGPSEICGRQPLKNLKGYGLKQTISLQIF